MRPIYLILNEKAVTAVTAFKNYLNVNVNVGRTMARTSLQNNCNPSRFNC